MKRPSVSILRAVPVMALGVIASSCGGGGGPKGAWWGTSTAAVTSGGTSATTSATSTPGSTAGTTSRSTATKGLGHSPANPTANDVVTFHDDRPGNLHWAVNGWTLPPAALQPKGTFPFPDNKSVETPLVKNPATGRYEARIGPFAAFTGVKTIDYVVNYGAGKWSAPPDRVVAIDWTNVKPAPPPVSNVPLPPRPNTVTMSYVPPSPATTVGIAGEFNNWQPQAMTQANGTWSITLAAPSPGEHGYKLVVNGKDWRLDPGNPYRKWVGVEENSCLRMDDTATPRLVLEWFHVASGTVEATVAYQPGSTGTVGDSMAQTVTLDGTALVSSSFDATAQRFRIKESGLAAGKHFLRVNARGQGGRPAAELYLPFWVESAPFRWDDAVLYFVLTDRFANGNPANDKPAAHVDARANYQGGDWAGLLQKINAGYFDDLSVNTLWLSAPNKQPDGPWVGDDGRNYSGFHGYWPTELTQTDSRQGSLDELRAVVKAAHARGIRVLFDFVGNHLHQDSPLWAMNQNNGWFNPRGVCGTPGHGWDGAEGEACWFRDYLPDFNYRKHEVLTQVADSAVFWLKETGADGFRLDAVKHMPHVFGTYLRARVNEELGKSGQHYYFVGETYTGSSGHQQIKDYVSKAELDGQFEFPLYWEIVKSMARREQNLRSLEPALALSASFYGPDAIMSTFLGNHDVPRFISHAANSGQFDSWGNGSKDLGWNNPPGAPADAWPYDRLKVAFSLLMTIKGVPLVYYGDEVGMPGAGDPDNRRALWAYSPNAHGLSVKAHLSKLARLRKEHAALRRGGYQNLWIDDDLIAFSRQEPGQPAVVVVINNGTSARNNFTLPFAGGAAASLPPGTQLTELVGGGNVTVAPNGITCSVPALGVAIFKKP